LKQSESGDGLVLRAVETNGSAAHACIQLPKIGRSIEADFGPGEIKTFLLPKDKDTEVYETNLLEWPAE
jgi:alpha-mannosidase